MVNVAVAGACNVTFVLPETANCPIVCVAGIPVTIVVTPLLKSRMSSTAGVVRFGVQLVLRAYEAVAPPFHVYVVAANALVPTNARHTATAKSAARFMAVVRRVISDWWTTAARRTGVECMVLLRDHHDAAPHTHSLPGRSIGSVVIDFGSVTSRQVNLQ
jgi:hypothetical protein